MLSRKVLFPLMMASAVGGPAAFFSADGLKASLASISSGSSSVDTVLTDAEGYKKTAEQPAAPAPLAALELVPLQEVFRFQATPQWVMGRWPRVSTQLADLDLQGYRVTLVSGTTPGDVAGSLTYYFDHQGQVQRITFRGTTGDPGPLAKLVTEHFGLQRAVGENPGEILFQEGWGGKTGSEVRFTPAAVVRSDNPQSRFAVEVNLSRPRSLW